MSKVVINIFDVVSVSTIKGKGDYVVTSAGTMPFTKERVIELCKNELTDDNSLSETITITLKP